MAELERSFAEMNKLKERPCAADELAYPKPSVGYHDSKLPEPSDQSDTRALGGTVSGLKGRSPVSESASSQEPAYMYAGVRWWGNVSGGFFRTNVASPTANHSISQAAFQSPDTNSTIEFGWRVVGVGTSGQNSAPQIFTFINKDDYQTTDGCVGGANGSCFNSNFVPAAGAQYKPGQTLVPSDPPYQDVTLEFGTRRFEGNWWLWVGDQWIGYIPGSFWPSGKFDYAARHDYYGEVIYWPSYGLPEMGNGFLGSLSSGLGAVMKTPSRVTNNPYTVHRESVSDANAEMYVTNGKVYNIGNVSTDGRFWRYGGPNVTP